MRDSDRPPGDGPEGAEREDGPRTSFAVAAPPGGEVVVLRRGEKLHRPQHVSRYLARLLRQLREWGEGDLTPANRIAKARAQIYGAAVLADVLKGSDLDQRLRRVEDLLRARGTGTH